MRTFDHHDDGRILFGPGSEAKTAEVLQEMGAQRVLLVAQGRHREGAERLAEQLGPRAVGLFDRARQHVPTGLVDEARAMARAANADWVLAHGGGTTTGFAKALALTEDVRVAVVPTTYAGSEGTSIWGLTGPDGKTTGRDARVKPSLVVYDAALTLGLDPKISLQSLFNALSHCLAVLTAPASDTHADEAEAAARQLLASMDQVAASPTDLEARNEALYGAYLASANIERAALGLHHKLAHVLGGTFDVVHASAHTASLPYSLHYNAAVVPRLVEALAPILGDDPAAALYDRARAWDLPHSFKGVGLTLDDLPKMVRQLLVRPYPNPRPTPGDALTELVSDAYHARRPSRFSRRRALAGTGDHTTLLTTERGTALDEAKAVLVAVHGRGAAADRITRDLEAHLDRPEGLCLLAPQAIDNRWYPYGFRVPLEDNQPDLDSALSMLDAAWAAATAVVDPSRVVVAGFSRGACLIVSWAKLRGVSPGAVLAFSGAELPVDGDYDALAASRVVISKSEGDPWIPQDAFDLTAAALREHVRDVEVRMVPGSGHAITEADGRDLAAAVAHVLAGSARIGG
ncbi:MAG: iron-containing alcohol dehydrogenase [Myxococcota bacterium]